MLEWFDSPGKSNVTIIYTDMLTVKQQIYSLKQGESFTFRIGPEEDD